MQVQEYTAENVKEHNKLTDAWVILNRHIYDITQFIDEHPGGRNVLKPYLGGDITGILHDPHIHLHSEAAFSIIENYKIGKLINTDTVDAQIKNDEIDYDKGILKQLCKIKNSYNEWVYKPIPGKVILFDSKILEALTRTHWMTVPIFWTPIIIYFMINLFTSIDASHTIVYKIIYMILSNALGILNWTFLEYFLHRYLFHMNTSKLHSGFMLFHFAIHGLHHKAPMDKYRLVFPPAPAVIFAILLFGIYRLVIGAQLMLILASGSLIGYVCYDMIHYFLHHGEKTNISFFKNLRTSHNSHHYVDPDLGFGISNSLWDWILRTQVKNHEE